MTFFRRLKNWATVPIRVRNATSLKPVANLIDVILTDKESENPSDLQERVGLFFRGLPKLSKSLAVLLSSFGLISVLMYYGHLHIYPRLENLGVISTLLLIGITGSGFLVVFCTLLLYSSLLLSGGRGPANRTNTFNQSRRRFAPRSFYVVYFASELGALVFLYTLLRFLSRIDPYLLNVILVAILIIPFLLPILVLKMLLKKRAFLYVFRAFWVDLAMASVFGFVTVATAAQLLYYGLDNSSNSSVFSAFAFAFLFVLSSAVPVFAGVRGVIGAYTCVVILVVLFTPSVFCDFPFRFWNVGAVYQRVVFLKKNEESRYRARCYVSSTYKQKPEIENAYRVYIYSSLPGEVWYRCDTHRLMNGQYSLPRKFDSANVLIEELGGSMRSNADSLTGHR